MLKSRIRGLLDDVQVASLDRIIAIIDRYDAVSFDVFDTLIKRDVPAPKDVFEIIGHNTGEKGFAQKRIRAERLARARKGEVKLEDIYDEYEGASQERRRFLMDAEIEHELNLCQPNLRMLPVFAHACEGKRVFLASDMYLSRAFMERMLAENGIAGYEALIVSNEVNKTKKDGSMYAYIKEHYHCGKLLHIGNDFLSDWLSARRRRIGTVKIRTRDKRLGRKYRRADSDRRNEYLEAFLSNRHSDADNPYYTFGFERFGPVLYGFTNWLLEQMQKAGVEQVLFMARDGYIMQKAYEALGFDKIIPDKYFEVSRRSLRVPSYSRSAELKDIMEGNSLISLSSIDQLMDNFGLESAKYSRIIQEYGFGGDKRFHRDELADDPQFNSFFDAIRQDVLENAKGEMENLLRYLAQFDFSRKSAIVDIGWGGTMQKYLVRTLNSYGIDNDISGYYFGMSKRWRESKSAGIYNAKGYLFDCLNDDDAFDMVIPFRSLFETLFLEQRGSVKRYVPGGNTTVAVRYDYEYEKDGKPQAEALAVREIHEGALDFVRAFQNSKIRDYVGHDARTMLKYLYQTGTNPCLNDLKMFGDFRYFDNGKSNFLAPRGNLGQYVFHPKRFIRDFSDAQWKVGFLKRVMKIPFPYRKAYMFLRRVGIKKDIS